MPAAANVERINAESGGNQQQNSKIVANNNNNCNVVQEPNKIVNTIIEKKIRNLEKRKARLLETKDKAEKETLAKEQLDAVKKLDSVVEMIDMLKEINKNIHDNLNDYAKQQKKQQKKEQQEKLIERNQCELERIKLFLRIQKILPCVTYLKQHYKQEDSSNNNDTDNVSKIHFDDKHIDALENLAQFSKDSNADLDEFAEKVHLILDGSKKEFSNGITHLEMKEMCVKIIENKCLDNIHSTSKPEISDEPSVDSSNDDCSEVKVTDVSTDESQSKTNEKPQLANVDSENHMQSSSAASAKPQVETDLQKDPAVIASGFAYPSFTNGNCPVNFLPATNTGIEYSPLLLHQAVGSIPSQTFTNQNYVNFIPNKVPIFDPSVPVVSSNQASITDIMPCNPVEQNQDSTNKFNGPMNDKIDLAENVEKPENFNNGDITSQQENDSINKNNDSSQVMNGHSGYPKRSNYRGRGGSGGRGSSSFRGGRPTNPKNFGGYFSGGSGHQTNPVKNFNGTNRPLIRQNGGSRGSYRGSNERGNGVNRNHFNPNINNQQPQGPSAAFALKP
uniref:Caprin-1-like n=1 Tax=Dermatophagoides pteronyssinus TaxID=6956 RepID=A0A6P6XP29_DERPT|nr:caprin-1-like [Dermatophagoides pteronyssinus]